MPNSDIDVLRARAELDAAHFNRLSRFQQAATDAKSKQSHQGVVTGIDRATLYPFVSAMGGGYVRAQPLSNNLGVGNPTNYFLPRDSAIGSADARPAG